MWEKIQTIYSLDVSPPPVEQGVGVQKALVAQESQLFVAFYVLTLNPQITDCPPEFTPCILSPQLDPPPGRAA